MSKEATDAILRKLRALMAKTQDSGCTEAEARAAAEAVDRIMGEYDVQLDDLTVRSTKCDKRVITVKDRKGPIRDAILAIAKFTDTRTWTIQKGMGVEHYAFFGLEPDLDIAEYLFWLFKRAIERETATFPIMNKAYLKMDDQRKQEARMSFGCGMARRLSERLTELKSKRDWTTEHTTGNQLIVLKGAIVTEEYAKLNLKLHKIPGLKPHDAQAFYAGLDAGDRVAINQAIGQAGAQKPLK